MIPELQQGRLILSELESHSKGRLKTEDDYS